MFLVNAKTSNQLQKLPLVTLASPFTCATAIKLPIKLTFNKPFNLQVLGLMAALLACQPSFALQQSKPAATPIVLDKGAVSTIVEGALAPKQTEHWYQFKASRGQYTVINILPKPGTSETANVGVLKFPSGAQDGTKGGIIYQGCLPETGTYQLRLARNLMATHGGKAGYRAEVIILPTYSSESLC